MKIGVFDSGLGGVNVLNEVIKKYPNNHFIYFGDNKNLPFGEKNKEELIMIAKKIIDFFVNLDVDVIIIACGTMSQFVNELSRYISIPLFDVLTPTCNYIINRYSNVGLIGTTSSINSKYFYNKLSPYTNVYFKSTPTFVPFIEGLSFECDVKEELNYFIDKDIEALILGCTHYPLIADKIKEILDVDLVDMGKCLSNYCNFTNNDVFKLDMYFSKFDSNLKCKINNILGNKQYQLFFI